MCCRACLLNQGHLLPVANLALHPSKPILATASDDKTWKLWHLPAGDLIMCGEGHRWDHSSTVACSLHGMLSLYLMQPGSGCQACGLPSRMTLLLAYNRHKPLWAIDPPSVGVVSGL